MFVFLGFIVFLILLFLLYFFAVSFRKISFLKNKSKVLSWVVALVPMIILFIVFNYINAIIVLFHYLIIFGIVSLISLLFKKKNYDIVVLVSIIITVLYLVYGAYQSYHIYETKYDINTTKEVDNFKIVGISDTHVGTTFDGEGFKKHIKKLSNIEADIFVIVGDFIDDDTTHEDMIEACSAFTYLHPKYGIYFVNGNHDRGYYNRSYSYDELISELEKNNVHVLRDEVVEINENIVLVGREDKQYERKNINDLVSGIDKSKYIIDLNHQPNDYNNEKGVVDLVISGHTHGGQLFPFGYVGLWIGANDEVYGLHNINNTNFIVTSGLSGWAMDFKTGTHSEYIIVNINGE